MRVTKEEMITNQLERRGVTNPEVLQAMRNIERELFVPEDLKKHAYEDRPLPIGEGQTISQPYIVAYMAQELQLESKDVVLEIGTGCGYNAAILSELVEQVYSIEVVEWLAGFAKENLRKAKIENVTTRHSDGFKGWEENAPYDAIILTAAPPSIPQPLKDQLKTGGRLLAPVGNMRQSLKLIMKTGENSFKEKDLLPVRFVPMTGKAQE